MDRVEVGGRQNSTLVHEGGRGSKIHVDTRSPKSAKNILKYLYFYKISPRGQSRGVGRQTPSPTGGGGGGKKQ